MFFPVKLPDRSVYSLKIPQIEVCLDPALLCLDFSGMHELSGLAREKVLLLSGYDDK